MSSAKKPLWAPGPWSYEDKPTAEIGIYMNIPEGLTDFAEFEYKSNVGVMLFHDIWTQFPPTGFKDMQRANAQLMAASPDLVEALVKMTRLVGELLCPDTASAEHEGEVRAAHAARDEALAALNKAGYPNE